MELKNYNALREIRGDLKHAMEEGFYPALLTHLTGFEAELSKLKASNVRIPSLISPEGERSPEEAKAAEIAQRNLAIIREIGDFLGSVRANLGQIGTEVWKCDPAMEKIRDLPRLERIAAAESRRTIVTVAGSKRPDELPRRARREGHSGGELGHATGDRIFEAHRYPAPRQGK